MQLGRENDRGDVKKLIRHRQFGRARERNFDRSKSGDSRAFTGVLLGDEQCFAGEPTMLRPWLYRVGCARVGWVSRGR